MAETPKHHYRILYYRGKTQIVGISDLYIDAGNKPPENTDGSFILSDAQANPLDWNVVKETPYVKTLDAMVQKMIEMSLIEEKNRTKRPVHGKQSMILDGSEP